MALTHRQIDVFRAVMAAGGVTRAAESLHTSQPSVSRELARLEREIGFALFDRVRGRLRPTARGLALREEVERSYVGLDRVAAAAVSLRRNTQGRLSVACLPALAHALLPDAARRFAVSYPEAGVSIVPQDAPWLDEWLSAQRFDLGLVERDEAPPGCEIQPLLVADEVAVLPAGHPLCRRRMLRLNDFDGQPFVSFAPDDPYRTQVDAAFRAAGVERRMTMETTSAVSVCALVRQGLGLGIVNPLTALEMTSAGMAVRTLGWSLPFHVSLVLPQLRPANPLRDAFVSALQDAAVALGRHLRATRRQGG